MEASAVAGAFVSRINAHDVTGLSALMTEDHVFIDALGGRVVGRAATKVGWQEYFRLVPDYWIRVEHVLERSGTVGFFGVAGGSYSKGGAGGPSTKWQAPAAWLAEVRGEAVALWRVYADNLPLRRLMEVEPR